MAAFLQDRTKELSNNIFAIMKEPTVSQFGNNKGIYLLFIANKLYVKIQELG